MKGDLNSRTCFIRNEELTLLPEKAIYWKRKKMLLLSDLHLAKSGHFRKAGIPIPSSVHEHDFTRLSLLIKKLKPETLCILGDLFHSRQNKEWKSFAHWRRNNSAVAVVLVRGNHDQQEEAIMQEHGVDRVFDSLIDPPFIFTHERPESVDNALYSVSGHIHPAVAMSGKGGQSASFPCFWFGRNFAVLPAFGNFTGRALIRPASNDRVFIIHSNRVEEIR